MTKCFLLKELKKKDIEFMDIEKLTLNIRKPAVT